MKIIVGIAFALGLLVGLSLFLFVPHGTPQVVYAGGTPSGNGDVNASGKIDIADAVYLLAYLFAKGPEPEPITGGGLPATGQTACYGSVPGPGWGPVPCESADWPGQDGFYGKGCPTAERYVDNQDGTVTDNCTGLMWQKDTADINGDGTYSGEDIVEWYEALQYCESLELAGHSDWRLPNIKELESIVDYGRYEPSTVFPVRAPFWWYWSSSSRAYGPDYAWLVYFYDGCTGHGYKGQDAGSVRAVRG